MLKIILNQKVDILLFIVVVCCLVIGLKKEDYELLAGGLLLSIGNMIFNFINKIILIKKGIL